MMVVNNPLKAFFSWGGMALVGYPYISIMISLGYHRINGPGIFSYIYWLMLMASMQVNIPVPWILWGWERQTGNLRDFGLDSRSSVLLGCVCQLSCCQPKRRCLCLPLGKIKRPSTCSPVYSPNNPSDFLPWEMPNCLQIYYAACLSIT